MNNSISSFSSRCLSVIITLLLAVFITSCTRGSLGSRTVDSIGYLALVIRVETEPGIRMKEVLGTSVDPDAAEEKILSLLKNNISPYAIEESIKHAFVESINDPLGTRIAPSIDVSTTMASLLVREENPRYDKLKSIGADTVLEVNVTEWGFGVREDAVGGYIRMESRLIRLGQRGERVIWRSRSRVDRSRTGGVPGLPLGRVLHSRAGLEEVMSDLARAAGAELADEMGLK